MSITLTDRDTDKRKRKRSRLRKQDAEHILFVQSFLHDMSSPINTIDVNNHLVESALRQLQDSQKTTSELSKDLGYMLGLIRRGQLATVRLRRQLMMTRQQLSLIGETEIYLDSQMVIVFDQFQELCAQQRVELSIDSPANVRLVGSPILFDRLLSNLIQNVLEKYEENARTRGLKAIRAERREIVISIRTTLEKTSDQHPQHASLVVHVQDWAGGIPQHILKKLFHERVSSKLRGGGYGLLSSKQLVEKNFHGTILVKSRKRIGTIVSIQFPLISA